MATSKSEIFYMLVSFERDEVCEDIEKSLKVSNFPEKESIKFKEKY